MAEIFTQILALALITEAITESVKDVIPARIHTYISSKIIAILISIAIAIYWEIDVTLLLNHKVDLLGSVLTGFIASRGANWVNDLSDRFHLKQNSKAP